MLVWVHSNYGLFGKQFTEGGLFPIQVFIEVGVCCDNQPYMHIKLIENHFTILWDDPTSILFFMPNNSVLG